MYLRIFGRALATQAADKPKPASDQVPTSSDNLKPDLQPWKDRGNYSPFQGQATWAEFALARVDDLLNWARKVCILNFFIRNEFQIVVSGIFVSNDFRPCMLCRRNDAHCCSSIRYG